MKRIFKYGTGESPPKGSIYLSTVTQTRAEVIRDKWVDCFFVWHYFLVEVKE